MPNRTARAARTRLEAPAGKGLGGKAWSDGGSLVYGFVENVSSGVGPGSEKLSDAQLEFLELEPWVSSAE